MKKVALLTLISTVALASCNMNRTPAAPTGQLAYGLSSDGKQLVTFGMDNADASYVKQSITGLGTDTLVDLDVRNTDGMLYGFASSGRVYLINPGTGSATADASVTGTTLVAADFNPQANRLRVIGANDANFRLTLNAAPVPGTAGTQTNDGMFSYAAADRNAGTNPDLVAAAYTNSFNDSATQAYSAATPTTLYTLDAATDSLVKHENNTTATPPLPTGNFSSLQTVGALGVNVMVGMTGFDIAKASDAYLSSVSGNDTNLYTVDLSSGKATMKGKLSGVKLSSLALKLAAQ
ncbi:DUF4394 domain-containing protein [Deinococcus caeni]|uniref:DUF4394 domain-containing protein n=1 Tax=Deinococcus caeni TaxID=569127 RepID=A0ABP9UAF6_9DEIO